MVRGGPRAPERRLGIFIEPKQRAPDPLPNASIQPVEELRRRRVYWMGLTDQEASKLLPITARAFAYWRNGRGLSPNGDGADGGDRTSKEAVNRRKQRLCEAAEELGTMYVERLRWEGVLED